MARGRNSGNGRQNKINVVYLQCDLTKAYKSELVKWLDSAPDFWDFIAKAIDSTLRFSCSYDAYNDCIQAQLTLLPENGSSEPTKILVGRGADLTQAIQALFFKYHVILKEKFEDGDLKNERGVTDWS